MTIKKRIPVKDRMEICMNCPLMERIGAEGEDIEKIDPKFVWHKCTDCGCILEFKTKLWLFKCPKGKW